MGTTLGALEAPKLEIAEPPTEASPNVAEGAATQQVDGGAPPAVEKKARTRKTSPRAQEAVEEVAVAKGVDAAEQPVSGELVEPEEVSFYELVPPEWRQQVRRPQGEVLGHLIHSWRSLAPNDDMVRTKDGFGFSMRILGELTSHPPDFLQSVARTGLLYVNPTTPGRLVHDLAGSAGGKKLTGFVIAGYAGKQLGLS